MKINHYMAFLRVAVDEYEEGRIAGSVYSQRLTEPFFFRNMSDLLLKIEDLLDDQDFPRAFQRKRKFDKAADPTPQTSGAQPREGETGYLSAEAVNQAQGKFCAFDLHIMTRQNTSWQGFVDWLDGTEKTAFNSVLELLRLLAGRFEHDGNSP